MKYSPCPAWEYTVLFKGVDSVLQWNNSQEAQKVLTVKGGAGTFNIPLLQMSRCGPCLTPQGGRLLSSPCSYGTLLHEFEWHGSCELHDGQESYPGVLDIGGCVAGPF